MSHGVSHVVTHGVGPGVGPEVGQGVSHELSNGAGHEVSHGAGAGWGVTWGQSFPLLHHFHHVLLLNLQQHDWGDISMSQLWQDSTLLWSLMGDARRARGFSTSLLMLFP